MKRTTFILTLLVCASRGAWALSVTPNVQAFQIKPGASIEAEVTIVNTDPEVIQVLPSTKNWFVLPVNKDIKVEDWLVMDSKGFSLEPSESKKLKFKVSVPKKAQGELVGMLSFHTKMASRSGVDFVLSAAVYAAVKGSEKLVGTIRGINISPSTGSITAGILVENRGNVHMRPYGLLQILDSKDQVVGNFELERGQPTYPGNQRPYVKTIKDLQLAPGKYTAEIELLDGDWGVTIEKKRQKFVLTEDLKVKY